MTTRRLLLKFLVSILLVGVTQAAPVSLSRATAIAEAFLTNSVPAVSGVKRAPARPRLVCAAAPKSAYYVFENEAGGFVIVSGDDVAYPILGYSNDRAADALYMPSNVQAWLNQYASQIQWARENDIAPDTSVVNAWKKISSSKKATEVVSPLLLTIWNQSPFYNDYCPMDVEKNERAVVGCVATAMAQVLKYWEAPTSGYGSYSYTHATYGTISADFENTTYDWANMPYSLTSASTPAEVDAVAKLMYHCGVSVQMNYGVESSGAFTISAQSNYTHCAEYALETYWGYDSGLKGYQKKDYKYKNKEWLDLIRKELDAARPVIYSGYGSGGGHCFVCDGYDDADYFHFNWGWGGLYDGFFKLDALVPGTGGTGSGSGDYNDDQQMIIGIKPNTSLTPSTNTAITLAARLSMPSTVIEPESSFTVNAQLVNNGGAFTGDVVLALLDADLELVYRYDQKTSVSMAAGQTVSFTFNANCSEEIPAGVYYVAVEYRSAGQTDWTQVMSNTYKSYLQMRIQPSSMCNYTPYHTTFETEPIGWTFAKADGVNTGFAIGGAMKYQGQKALYISPDGGATAGYTADSPTGYVSLAYKKIYLERGNYKISHRIYTNLSDAEEFGVFVTPESDGPLTPQNNYLDNKYPSSVPLRYVFSSDFTWYDYDMSFSISENGYYYLTYSFAASSSTPSVGQVVAVDDVRIIKNQEFEIKYEETKDGVLFRVIGNFESYKCYYYSTNNYSSKYVTLNANNEVLIPYSKLREAIYDYNIYSFVATGICDGVQSNSKTIHTYLKTDIFPQDTCPLVPYNLTAQEEARGVSLVWSGNSPSYEIKVSTSSPSGKTDDSHIIASTVDTTFLVTYNPSHHLKKGTNYIFVRGICPNDTSIWQRVEVNVKGGCDTCCLKRPESLYTHNTAQGIELTWQGNAPQYQVVYWPLSVQSSGVNWDMVPESKKQYMTVTDTSCLVPYINSSDVIYKFLVRAICDGDTSLISDIVQAYNINFGDDYCIPFYDFYGKYTEGTYGSYAYPYSNKGIIDYGYNKRGQNGVNGYLVPDSYTWCDFSSHTIIYEPGQTDVNTANVLSTIPKGEKYSVRLGNDGNADGESITYTHKIDSGYPLILLLKYAVVLQDPSHTPEKNPHFTLEILDEKGVALDPICWNADFAADKNAEGWHNAPNDVVWKDWTTIGVNLTELSKDGDKIIKIRLTTKDCALGQHFGYAYFTLSCTTGDMQGMSCGERPEKFEVAEGFKYRWYLMDDPSKTLVCDSNVFIVQPNDTNSYHVDMISLENEDCFYTLSAYTLPRLPRAQATFTHTPENCVNAVTIHNTSYVYKKMLDGTEQKDGRIAIDSIQWDFGEYGKSTELEPQLIVPNEGDTFKVALRVVANGCSEEKEYTLSIPAIRDTTTMAHRYLCKGDTLLYNGKEYYTAGVYTDSLKRTYGCDSVHILTVEYLEPEYKLYYDTICAVEVPYTFFNKPYTQSGIYEEHIASTLGCDTIIHQLHLLVLDSLQIVVHDGMEKSRDCGQFLVPYTLLKGTMLGYTIDYSDDANANGFVDIVNDTARSTVKVVVPPTCDAKTYSAVIKFHNGDCPSLELPLKFTITMYSKPESQATFVHAPHDCINQVNINNLSAVYKHYNDSIKKVDPTQSIESYFWDLGPYGQSNLAEPELIVPQQGDTFTVTLTTTYGAYTHTEEYLLEIPSILENNGYIYQYICQGEKIMYNGTEYSTPGQYVLDVVTSSVGCDSTSYLVIAYLEPEIVELYDTICYNQLPYDFYGQSCYTADSYEHVVKAKAGCDSIIYQLNLYVYEELKVVLNELPEICSGDPSFDVSYTTLSGSISGISVRFSEEAKALGFMDATASVETNNMFTLDLPQDIRPDVYMAEVLFDNHGCEVINLPLAISVDYSNEVITQRWNDFLSVRQTAYTYYDGFISYQWYCNGNLIEGATTSQLYKPEGLGENTYQVELVRATDGVKAISCPFIPTEQPNTTTLEVQPTITAKGAPIRVKAPNHGDMDIIGNVGVNMGTQYLQEGENTVTVPTAAGIYLLHLTTEDGNQYVQKIIVY